MKEKIDAVLFTFGIVVLGFAIGYLVHAPLKPIEWKDESRQIVILSSNDPCPTQSKDEVQYQFENTCYSVSKKNFIKYLHMKDVTVKASVGLDLSTTTAYCYSRIHCVTVKLNTKQ